MKNNQARMISGALVAIAASVVFISVDRHDAIPLVAGSIGLVGILVVLIEMIVSLFAGRGRGDP